MQRRKPKNEKHEMEVEIEKTVKAQKEAQSAARRTRRKTSRKWKLNSRRFVMIALMDKNLIPSARRIAGAEGHQQKDAQEIIQFERVDFEQVAEKRQACDVAKNGSNFAKQSDVSKNTQHNVKWLPWKSKRNL